MAQPFTSRLNPSLVEPHDFTHDAQTDAESRGFARPHLREQIENVQKSLRLDATSRVD